jgi:hypothetical protein
MTTPHPSSEKKKPSVLKIIGVYCLVWLVVAAVFIAYVTLAPNHGGFVQATANFVAMFAGIAFVPGLILVLAVKGGVHLFPKPHKEKSYYDELPK